MKTLLFCVFFLSNVICALEITPRIGAFFPQDRLFSDIYGSVGPSYELELGINFFPYLAAWANGNASPFNGHSIGDENPTSIVIANGSFGLKLKKKLGKIELYAGVGPLFSGIFINNPDSFCCAHSSAFAAGGVVKSGAHFYLINRLFLDFFADYYLEWKKYEETVALGGVHVGAGLGVRF